MKRLLQVLQHETLVPPPVWLMRQAGRYLPEYRALRSEAGSFLQLCYDPAKAAEATLQPLRRFDLDAAILFSDILVVPHALGQELTFAEGEGPRLPPLETLPSFDPGVFRSRLAPVYEALGLVKAALPREATLIGFAGAPWTLACYMLDGQGGGGFPRACAMARRATQSFAELIELLIESVVEHLSAQVEAGAEVLQLFDSWAGLLEGDLAEAWCIGPLLRVVHGVAVRHPGVPVILFPRGASPEVLLHLAEDGRAAGLSLGTEVDAAWAGRALQPRIALQGNLDPRVLVAGGRVLDEALERLVEALGKGPWICNLGHGVVPETPPENVAHLVARLRGSRA